MGRQAEDFIYLPHNNLRTILIIQRTKDHWRPLAGTVQLGKLENAQIRMLQQMQLLLTTTKAPNQVIPSAQTSSLGGPPNELVHYQLAGRPSRGAARWEALPTSWYTTSSLGGTPDELVHYQLAGRHSRRAGTLPARWEALPTSWYTTSSLGGTPDELVHYQLAGRHSRRAGTLPARWEALPTSWYTTSSLGGTPDELVHYQLAGKHSRQAGTLPARW
ncbi:hypothetical protein PCASD_07263 [Puccinia coronata f. sp. avenae]|uniref:Uncharacterized protein n=1 Tax=Puccinia coronata f. sp. avenae TaxID=200324 RepID=A0A2N5UYJ8_9BASI|nr:hypothetical protein PCASD_07263 [Puccinia coronata f. sp. avenae]